MDLVVEYLLLAAARPVLHVGQGPDAGPGLKHRPHVVDLSTRIRGVCAAPRMHYIDIDSP